MNLGIVVRECIKIVGTGRDNRRHSIGYRGRRSRCRRCQRLQEVILGGHHISVRTVIGLWQPWKRIAQIRIVLVALLMIQMALAVILSVLAVVILVALMVAGVRVVIGVLL